MAADAIGLRPLLLGVALLTGTSGLLAALVLKESGEGVGPAPEGAAVRRTFLDVLVQPRTRAFVVAGVCAQVGVYGLVTVFAPHVEGLLARPDRAQTWVGVLQAAAWGAGMLSAPWWGRRNDRTKVERNFFWASVGCGLGVALLAVPEHVVWLIPLRVLQGFFFGALLQSVFLAVVEEAEKGDEGTRVGATNSFLVAGQVVGALLGGVLGGFLTTDWMLVAMGGVFLVGAAWMIPLWARQSRERLRTWNTEGG